MAASHTVGAEVRSFSRRLLAALRFDARVYREAAADRGALAQAAVVVVLGGLARGIGAVGEEGVVGLVGSPLIGLLIWLASAAVVWAIGVRHFGYTSDYGELLRTLGFAAAPLLWLALCALPLGAAEAAVWLAAHALAVAALVLAVREALDVGLERALVVCALALLVSFVALFLLGILLVGRGASG